MRFIFLIVFYLTGAVSLAQPPEQTNTTAPQQITIPGFELDTTSPKNSKEQVQKTENSKNQAKSPANVSPNLPPPMPSPNPLNAPQKFTPQTP